MHRRFGSLCLAEAWATANIACAGDTGGSSTGTGGSSTDAGSSSTDAGTDDPTSGASETGGEGTTTVGASDPGNDSVSSAGDGVGEVPLYVAAGGGVAGLDPGTEVQNTVDGWTVDYDKIIVMVGSWDAHDGAGDLPLGTDAGVVIDLRQVAKPLLLTTAEVAPGGFSDFQFSVPNATEASRLVSPATDADYALMVKGGYSIYMEGTLSNPAGQSCGHEDPITCTPAPTITFKWGLAAATEFLGCPGFTVERDQTTDVTLTIPGDHWFRSSFTPDGLLPRRAQWIVDADLDHNGETTLEELKMLKASLLFTPELDYDLAGSPIPIDTAHDFLEAQVRTLGLNTETGCQSAKAL